MERLELNDIVRLRNGHPDRYGRVIDFAWEDGVRWVLVEWPDLPASADPEESLERIEPA